MLRPRNRDGYDATGRRLYWLDLPGSGGGGSQQQAAPVVNNTTSTTQVQNFTPEEQARRNLVQTEATRLYRQQQGTATNPGTYANYPGAQIAGPSAQTQAAERALATTSANVQQNINPNLQSALNYNLTSARDVNSNPFLRGAIDAAVRPLNEQFTQAGGTLSQIRSGANDAQQGGGTREGIAQGIATRALTNQVGDVTAKIGSEAYKAGLDASGKAITATPAAQMALLQPTTWDATLGATADNRAQQALNRESDVRQWNMNAPMMPLRNFANLIYGGGSSGSSSTSNTPMYTPSGSGASGGGNALSTLGTVAGIGSSIASMASSSF